MHIKKSKTYFLIQMTNYVFNKVLKFVKMCIFMAALFEKLIADEIDKNVSTYVSLF